MPEPDSGLAVQQEEVERLKAEKQELEADLQKARKEVDDAQSQIGKQGKELGDYRGNIDKLVEKIEALETKIGGGESSAAAGAAKTPEEIEKEQKLKQEAEAKAEVERLQSLLKDEDDEALNEAYDALTPQSQAEIDNNPAVRKKFLEKYLGERAVPRRTWKSSKPEGSTETVNVEDELDKVFDKKKRESNFSPANPTGVHGGMTGKTVVRQEEKSFDHESNAGMLGIGQKREVDPTMVWQGESEGTKVPR